MAADGHKEDGSDVVRRLRKERFVRPTEPGEFTSEQRDLPVFPTYPADERQARAIPPHVAASFTANFAKMCGAWKNRLSQRFASLSFDRRPQKETDLVARVALILLLAPLAIALAPSRLPRMAKIAPPNFILDDRLSFAEGLRQKLASQTVSFRPKQAVIPVVKSQVPPLADEDSPPVPQDRGRYHGP